MPTSESNKVVILSLMIASAAVPHAWDGIARSGIVITPGGFLAGVAFGLTLITNIWATVVIGIRAWCVFFCISLNVLCC